jgi:hypothetical protein
MTRHLLRGVVAIFCVTAGVSAQTDRKLTESEMLNFCSLIVTDTWEDGVAYVESKGVDLDEAWEDVVCGTFDTALPAYLVKETSVRSLLMLRRRMLNDLDDPDRFLALITTRTPFNSTSNRCALGTAQYMLSSNPTDDRLKKLISLLTEWGATDCVTRTEEGG